MDEQDEEIVWANIHYGRGVPIPVETTADRVIDAFNEVGPGCYAVTDEDFGFCAEDIDRTGERINSERQALRVWWESYGSYSIEDYDEDDLEYIENVLKLKLPADSR